MNKENILSDSKRTGNEIDFVELVKKIWVERKTIFWGVGISIVIGLIVAFTSPKRYKVVTTMLPQSEDGGGGMGNFSSLAAIAGFDIDLSDNGADISPVIYPQILASEPFLLNLMHTKYTFREVNHPVSLYDYITKIQKPGIGDNIMQYTVGLPALIKKQLKKKSDTVKVANDGLTHMTEDEYQIAKWLEKTVTLTTNKKEGYLTLTSIFDEDLLTAQVAKRAQDLLQEEITNYKTKRAMDQLDFFEKRYQEKKTDYLRAQNRLASYKDRNLFMSTAVGSSEETRLQNEYNLTFTVYSELSKQLENAKIKVKRVTPVYIIIKPVVVPLEPFEPKKKMILLVWIMIGAALSAGIVLGKYYYAFLKRDIKE
jgi:LPS O-antigen subunit length determinant protein (WzzB/FepE family)